MNVVTRSGLRAVLANGTGDLDRALALRRRCFRASDPDRDDRDSHDDRCAHVLIEDAATGAVVACCRVLVLADGGGVGRTYSARHYDLGALGRYPDPMLEIGRFCIDPDTRDPEVLRFAWAALTRLVDLHGVRLIFGCSSFAGALAAQHHAALLLWACQHPAPELWAPRVRSAEVIHLGAVPHSVGTDAVLPPLLRSYLSMGGWISDHAVIDRDLDTLHVFTALEVSAIPPARAGALRQMAAALKVGTLFG